MNISDLILIIKKAINIENINLESSSENTEEWDSLGHLSILVALDKELNGKLSSIPEIATADSVEAIIAILRKNHLIDEI